MRIRHIKPPGWRDTAEPGKIQPSHVAGLDHVAEMEPGDAVFEAPSVGDFPAPGLSGVIYIDTSEGDAWRWDGAGYVRVRSIPASSDLVPEGEAHRYFSAARVLGTLLSGFSAASSLAVAATDTVLAALGKLQAQITGHKARDDNPHGVTKAQMNLGNVDNTSDADKPLSHAAQAALAAEAAARIADDAALQDRLNPVVTALGVVSEPFAVMLSETRRDTATGDDTTTHMPLPVASASRHGLMPHEAYAQMEDSFMRIGALEGRSSRYAVTIPDAPTQGQLSALYNAASGTTGNPEIDAVRLVDVSKNIVWTWFASDFEWHGPESDTVWQASNVALGVVKGSELVGKIFIELDGTMSLVGYDAILAGLDGKAATTHTHTKSQITDFPAIPTAVPKTTTTPKANGTAAIGTETAYAAGDHVHPTDTTRAPANATLTDAAGANTLPATSSNTVAALLQTVRNCLKWLVAEIGGKAPATHTHTKSQITDFPAIPTAVPKTTTTPKANGTAAIGTETAYAAGDHVHPTDTTRAATTHSHAWADVTGKPATFPPSAHNHSIANIADLQSSLGNAFVAVTKYGQSTVILRLTRASGSYVDVILSEEDNSAGN